MLTLFALYGLFIGFCIMAHINEDCLMSHVGKVLYVADKGGSPSVTAGHRERPNYYNYGRIRRVSTLTQNSEVKQ